MASGRTMAQIAARQGQGAEAVHAGQGKTKADAVWQSNRGDAADARAQRKTAALRAPPETRTGRRRKAKPKKAAAMPDFVAPQLCTVVERPPGGEGWCHEIKFDGYRVQMRVEDGEAALQHPQGARLDRQVQGDRRGSGDRLPDVLIDGEIVALDHNGAPDFSSLQAALSDGDSDEPDLLCVRPAVRRRRGSARPAARRAQGAAEEAAGSPQGQAEADPLCRAFRERRRRRAAIGLQAGAGRHRLQEARRALSLRPRRRAGPRRNAAPGTRWCWAAGRPPTASSAR